MLVPVTFILTSKPFCFVTCIVYISFQISIPLLLAHYYMFLFFLPTTISRNVHHNLYQIVGNLTWSKCPSLHFLSRHCRAAMMCNKPRHHKQMSNFAVSIFKNWLKCVICEAFANFKAKMLYFSITSRGWVFVGSMWNDVITRWTGIDEDKQSD